MTKITFTNKIQGVSNPLPEEKKFTFGNANEVKNSVNALYNVAGWVEYKDLTNTVSSKQALTAGQANILTIDGASTIKTYKPLGMGNSELWATNKITPLALGDSYMVRVDFEADISNANGHFDVDCFIGGAIGRTYKDSKSFPKGANTAHSFSINFLIYSLDTFIANGGQIRITPSHSMNIWDKRIIIDRLYSSV